MAKPPFVDTVLAQLNNLSMEDLQLVIQTADNIRQDIDREALPSPEIIEPLAKELREISEITINIPVQLQFQLKAVLKYQGPGGSILDQVSIVDVTIKEGAKSTIPIDMLLPPHEGRSEGLMEEILLGFEPASPGDIVTNEVIKKACPALATYVSRIEAFEGKLTQEGEKLDMSASDIYDSVDWCYLPKKGKKKAGKKRATRMPY